MDTPEEASKEAPKPRRVFAFIDRPNLDRTTKDLLGFTVDWELLCNHLKSDQRKWQCEKVFIYTGTKETAVTSTTSELTKMGYEARVRSSRPQKDKIREHPYKCSGCGKEDKVSVLYPGSVKSNCDVDLTVDAMQYIDSATEFLIFTGDGDFESLIVHAMEKGVHVRIVSNTSRDKRGDKRFSTRLQTILDEEITSLEQRASFIDINDWKNSIQRKPPSSVAASDRT